MRSCSFVRAILILATIFFRAGATAGAFHCEPQHSAAHSQSGLARHAVTHCNVGLAQIVAGLAWWYREYAREQSSEDRGRYKSDEQEVMLRKRGDKAPVPPREWRSQKMK
jgi:hypothetical protein